MLALPNLKGPRSFPEKPSCEVWRSARFGIEAS
uniref:UORF n=1 Tax=Homo sapiens TaxID=9606 RepID=Q8WXQ9_HUMAN|nr:uORF A [Homo sapiens]AAN17517.1 uORF [Homo sapiens]